jgi:hypothetical protein
MIRPATSQEAFRGLPGPGGAAGGQGSAEHRRQKSNKTLLRNILAREAPAAGSPCPAETKGGSDDDPGTGGGQKQTGRVRD